MADPNENELERRLVASAGPAVRVVLAEVDAPGSLHYLLEAEGFHVIGCASDELELGRVLGQDLDPDVIVLDADVAATSALVARELAADAHLIAVWPDDVLPPPGGERISPRLVYEDLGPAIRRHMEARVVPVPDIVVPSAELAAVGAATGGSALALGRAASRLSVTSVTLLTAILLTMGVSFALGGFRSGRTGGPPRIVAPITSTLEGGGTPDPITGRVARSDGSGHPTDGGPGDRPAGPNGHHDGNGGQNAPVVNGGGEGNTGEAPPAPVDQSGDPGNQGGGSGDQGGQGDQGGGQGDQGGGQGDQGGGQGDQGGGQGDQGGGQGGQGGGGQGDQGGGQGDQGGGQGDQGGGQGDQGGGEGDQGDQDDQGGSGDHGNQDGQGDQADQDDQQN
jgi:hypothetical protein